MPGHSGVMPRSIDAASTLESLMHPVSLLRVLCFTLICLLGACGGGGEESGPDPLPEGVSTEPDRTTAATIGSRGGTLSATSSAGVRYTLHVPAGALTADTEISLTPITGMADAPLAQGLRGAVRFAPGGLVFLRQATLRIEGAAPARAGQRSVGFSRSEDGRTMRLSLPGVAAGGALDVPVFHFSDAGLAQGTQDEIALVPLASPSEIVAERMFEAAAREELSTLDSTAALFERIFVEVVKPALDAGAASDETALREEGLDAYMQWERMKLLSTDETSRAALDGRLAATLAVARPLAAELSRDLLETRIDECVADPAGLAFDQAMTLRLDAAAVGLATTAFGLAPADTLRQVNDCMRLVIDPITLPDPMPVGTPQSLDARVRLVPASRPQELLDANVEFTVTAVEATLDRATGLSDAAGRYTTVFTAGSAEPIFTVQACHVVPGLDPRVTDLCSTRTVPEAPPPFVARTFKGTYVTTSRPPGVLSCAIDGRGDGVPDALPAYLKLETEGSSLFVLDTQNDNRDDNGGFFARISLSSVVFSGTFRGTGQGAFSFSDRSFFEGPVSDSGITLTVRSITARGEECLGQFVGTKTDEILP
jgi:hypothetical protein